jgi:hypothetical protein
MPTGKDVFRILKYVAGKDVDIGAVPALLQDFELAEDVDQSTLPASNLFGSKRRR